jgi:hypothetical protein
LKRIIDENYDFFKLELYYDNGILKEMKFLWFIKNLLKLKNKKL